MSIVSVLVSLAALAWILYRQLQVRAVRSTRSFRMVVIFAVIGVVETAKFGQQHTISAAAWGLLVASLLVGAGFGAVRAMTVRVWRDGGVLYRKGSVLTLVLWLVGIALHLSVDLLIKHIDHDAAGLGNVATLLYLALSLGIQQLLVQWRAERLPS
jgi:hypothetical protein